MLQGPWLPACVLVGILFIHSTQLSSLLCILVLVYVHERRPAAMTAHVFLVIHSHHRSSSRIRTQPQHLPALVFSMELSVNDMEGAKVGSIRVWYVSNYSSSTTNSLRRSFLNVRFIAMIVIHACSIVSSSYRHGLVSPEHYNPNCQIWTANYIDREYGRRGVLALSDTGDLYSAMSSCAAAG